MDRYLRLNDRVIEYYDNLRIQKDANLEQYIVYVGVKFIDVGDPSDVI